MGWLGNAFVVFMLALFAEEAVGFFWGGGGGALCGAAGGDDQFVLGGY